MRHHGTDPRHFLQQTHQFPDLARMVVFERRLKACCAACPGAKSFFQRPAPLHRRHARLTGLATVSDAVYSVETPLSAQADARRLPRPAPGRRNLDPRRCIMVEDSLPNLVTAKNWA
jgi:putative hydrolase of the HAD superfamily